MFTTLLPYVITLTDADRKALEAAALAYITTEMEEPTVLPAPSVLLATPEGPERMRVARTIAAHLQVLADGMLLPLAFYAVPPVPARGEGPALPIRLMVRARG